MQQRLEKQQKGSVELRDGFLKRTDKTDKYLARLRDKNKQRNKISKIRNEKEDTTKYEESLGKQQIKTTMSQCFIPVRMSGIKMTADEKC